MAACQDSSHQATVKPMDQLMQGPLVAWVCHLIPIHSTSLSFIVVLLSHRTGANLSRRRRRRRCRIGLLSVDQRSLPRQRIIADVSVDHFFLASFTSVTNVFFWGGGGGPTRRRIFKQTQHGVDRKRGRKRVRVGNSEAITMISTLASHFYQLEEDFVSRLSKG